MNKFFLSAAACLLSVIAAGQQFITSAIAELPVGSSASVTKVANDIREYQWNTAGPAYFLQVTAWDGTTPGLYYKTDDPNASPASGTIALPANTSDPDVVISDVEPHSINPYILLVYKKAAVFYFQCYKWTLSGPLAIFSNTYADIPGSYTSNIAIDATSNGTFAMQITCSDGSIKTYTGTNNSLAFNTAPTLRNTLPAGTGHHTDICINSKFSMPVYTVTGVHLTYTNLNNTQLYTRYKPDAQPSYNPATVIAGAVQNHTYKNPRIASPIFNAGTSENNCEFDKEIFSVIYNNYFSPYGIITMYSEDGNGSYFNRPLTAGAAGFPSAIKYNERPALSYNEKAIWLEGSCQGEITTGWKDMIHQKMIGLKMRSNCVISANSNSNYYYEMTPANPPNHDLVAISSKYAGDLALLSFYDNVSQRVYSKTYSYIFDPTMRTAGNHSSAMQQKQVQIYPIPAHDRVTIDAQGIYTDDVLHTCITDITGHTVYQYDGTAGALPENINSWFTTASPGMYFFAITDNAGFSQNIKLLKE